MRKRGLRRAVGTQGWQWARTRSGRGAGRGAGAVWIPSRPHDPTAVSPAARRPASGRAIPGAPIRVILSGPTRAAPGQLPLRRPSSGLGDQTDATASISAAERRHWAAATFARTCSGVAGAGDDRAHDRLAQEPPEGQVQQRVSALGAKLAKAAMRSKLAGVITSPARALSASRPRSSPPCVYLPVRNPDSSGIVGDDAQAVGHASGDDLALDSADQQVVVHLGRDRRHEVLRAGRPVGVGDLPGCEVAVADVPDLAARTRSSSARASPRSASAGQACGPGTGRCSRFGGGAGCFRRPARSSGGCAALQTVNRSSACRPWWPGRICRRRPAEQTAELALEAPVPSAEPRP